jgi:hypothetical protein
MIVTRARERVVALRHEQQVAITAPNRVFMEDFMKEKADRGLHIFQPDKATEGQVPRGCIEQGDEYCGRDTLRHRLP